MIYVLTPFRSDFVMHCNEFFIHPQDSRAIRWIDDWQKLLGLKIFKDDKVIWGSKAAFFKPEQFERLQIELAIRTEK